MTGLPCGSTLAAMSDDVVYTLALRPSGTHLRAHVSGPRDTIAVARAYWGEILAECARTGLRRLLVVEDFGTRGTREHAMEMLELLARHRCGHMCIAYVDRAHDDGTAHYAETQARYLGLTGRVFRSEAIALDWLLDCPLPDAR